MTGIDRCDPCELDTFTFFTDVSLDDLESHRLKIWTKTVAQYLSVFAEGIPTYQEGSIYYDTPNRKKMNIIPFSWI